MSPATISDAGDGLFATRDLARNAAMGQYVSEALTPRQFRRLRWPTAYALSAAGGVTLDARRVRNWCAYANDAQDMARTNLVARQVADGTVWLFTKRAVAAEAELFLAYGRLYWLDADRSARGAAGKLVVLRARGLPRQRAVAEEGPSAMALRSHGALGIE